MSEKIAHLPFPCAVLEPPRVRMSGSSRKSATQVLSRSGSVIVLTRSLPRITCQHVTFPSSSSTGSHSSRTWSLILIANESADSCSLVVWCCPLSAVTFAELWGNEFFSAFQKLFLWFYVIFRLNFQKSHLVMILYRRRIVLPFLCCFSIDVVHEESVSIQRSAALINLLVCLQLCRSLVNCKELCLMITLVTIFTVFKGIYSVIYTPYFIIFR